MIRLTYVFRKSTGGYKCTKSQEKIYHLMDIGDIEHFAKYSKELETLIQIKRIFSQDIKTESPIFDKFIFFFFFFFLTISRSGRLAENR